MYFSTGLLQLLFFISVSCFGRVPWRWHAYLFFFFLRIPHDLRLHDILSVFASHAARDL